MAILRFVQRGIKTYETGLTQFVIQKGVDAGFHRSVDKSKSIVIITARPEETAANSVSHGLTSWQLNDAGTAITVNRNAGTSIFTVAWEIWTFSTGVLAQHIVVSNGAGTTGTITIAAPSFGGNRWIVPCGQTGTSVSSRTALRWTFDNNTTVRWTRNNSGGGTFANGRAIVVEYDAANVQTISGSLSASTAQDVDVEVPVPVALNKSMVFGSISTTFDTNPVYDNIFWSPRLTSTSNVRMSRSGSGVESMDYNMFVVTFTDETNVQQLTSQLAIGASTTTASFTPVAANRTGVYPQGMFPQYYGVGGGFRGATTFTLINTTDVLVQRGPFTTGIWFQYGSVVEFEGINAPQGQTSQTEGQNPFTLTQLPVGNYIELLPL